MLLRCRASVLGTSSKTFCRRLRAGQGGKLIQNQRVNPPNNETGRLSPRLAQQTAYSGHSLDTRELCAWGRARVKPSQSWLRKASARLICAKTVLGSQVGPGWPLVQQHHVMPPSRPESRELRPVSDAFPAPFQIQTSHMFELAARGQHHGEQIAHMHIIIHLTDAHLAITQRCGGQRLKPG